MINTISYLHLWGGKRMPVNDSIWQYVLHAQDHITALSYEMRGLHQ